MNSVLSHVGNAYLQIMLSGNAIPYSVLGLDTSFHTSEEITVQSADLQGLDIKMHREEVGHWGRGSPMKSLPACTENYLLTETQEKSFKSVLV